MDHEWVISQFIIDELARKLKEKFNFPENEIAEIRESIVSSAETVTPIEVAPAACRDPNDSPILGTAVAARADLLITVDKDLLALGAHGGIPIIKPGGFWKRAEQEIEPPSAAPSTDE
jgi:putative PIN family toxin of toxin-antitoxin system